MARTPSDLVTAGVTGHALTDRYLAKAYKEQLKVIKAAEEALAQGLVSDGMVAKQFIWGHRAALGRIADAGKALADIHPLGTSLAKENGVDLGNITEAGGVALPQPEISPMSGSR